MSGPWEKYGAQPATQTQDAPWLKYPQAAAEPAPQSLGDKITQGVGNLAAGAIRGAGSIGATILAPIDIARDAMAGKGLSLESNRERRQAMDEGLAMMGAQPESWLYKGAKLGGEIAGTAGAGGAIANTLSRVPGAVSTAAPVLDAIRTAGMTAGGATGLAGAATRALGGAVTGGVSAGLVNPNEAGAGALVGAAAPSVVKGLGLAGQAVRKALQPSVNNPSLAKAAIEQYGIPLGPADISGSRFVKAARSVLNDAPIVGAVGEAQGNAVQSGFNRAIGETFGAPAEQLTPKVLDAAKKRMGAEFDRIWGSNALQVDGALIQKLSDIQNAAIKLPRAEGGSLGAEIQDLLSKVVPDASGNLTIPGDVANKFQSYLRRRAEGSTGLRYELGDLRQSIISAFNRGVSPKDAAALATNRGQYKAFKTVEPLLAGAEAGVAGREVGNVPAGLLPQAVRKSYGANISRSPFADLSQIASQYLVNRTPQTGGSARAAIQNSAIGAALTAGGISNPLVTAAVIPAAFGAQKALGSPSISKAMIDASTSPGTIQQLLNDPAFQQALLRIAPVAVADR